MRRRDNFRVCDSRSRHLIRESQKPFLERGTSRHVRA